MIRINTLLLVILVYLSTTCMVHSIERVNVNVYVYHLKPPFITHLENEQGLYYEFSNYLTSKSQQYRFKTVFIPRKRIDLMIKEKTLNGVLLGVNPVWFKDKKEQKYLWTAPVFTDQDEVISLKSNPIEFSTPFSLENLVFGGVRGFYYYGINELVDQDRINRIDTISEQALINMLIKNRIDCAIISRSTFDYITGGSLNRELFHVSTNPHDKYTRKVLVLHQDQAIYDDIEAIIVQMKQDSVWTATLLSYLDQSS